MLNKLWICACLSISFISAFNFPIFLFFRSRSLIRNFDLFAIVEKKETLPKLRTTYLRYLAFVCEFEWNEWNIIHEMLYINGIPFGNCIFFRRLHFTLYKLMNRKKNKESTYLHVNSESSQGVCVVAHGGRKKIK